MWPGADLSLTPGDVSSSLVSIQDGFPLIVAKWLQLLHPCGYVFSTTPTEVLEPWCLDGLWSCLSLAIHRGQGGAMCCLV